MEEGLYNQKPFLTNFIERAAGDWETMSRQDKMMAGLTEAVSLMVGGQMAASHLAKHSVRGVSSLARKFLGKKVNPNDGIKYEQLIGKFDDSMKIKLWENDYWKSQGSKDYLSPMAQKMDELVKNRRGHGF